MKIKQNWVIGGITLLCLCGVLLIVLPNIVKHEATAWLEQNGIDKAHIGDVDINLFTGKLGIFDLQLLKDGAVTLKFWRVTADIEWWPLLRKRLLIKNIWLYDLDMLIEQDKQQVLHIGGITLPMAGAKDAEKKPVTETSSVSQWGVGLDALGIKNTKLRIRSPEYSVDQEVQINSLYVSDVLSWTPEHPAPINLDMLIDGNPVRMQSHVRAFQKNPDIETKLDIKQLDLSLYAPISRLFGIEDLAGILSLEMNSRVILAKESSSGNAVAIEIKTDLELGEFRIRYGDLYMTNQSFTYRGNASLHLPVRPATQLLTTGGEVEMDNLAVDSGPYTIRYENLVWHGNVQVTPQNSQGDQTPQNIDVTGDLGIRDLAVVDNPHNMKLAAINKINAEGIDIGLPEQVQVKSLAIASLQALQPNSRVDTGQDTAKDKMPPVMDVANVYIDTISYQLERSALDLSTIVIAGMKLIGKRASDGSFYAIDQLLGSASEEAEEVETSQNKNVVTSGSSVATTEKKDALRIKVDSVKLGSNSEAIFIDQSVKPEFKATIAPLSLVLNHINSGDKRSATNIEFDAALSKGNDISIKGTVTPFADKRDIHLKSNIKALDLVFVSPYAASAIGYFIKSGRLNSKMSLDVDQDYLKVTSAFEFQRLTLAPASEDARMTSSKSIGIPLGAALALMKDRDGNIKLEVPVEGDLNDPKFNLGPAIRSAGTEAVKKASVAYATLALQPYGAILLGAKLLSAATAMRLESVHFDPGSPDINEDAQKYLGKIGSLMNERPGINLTLCGIATRKDEAILKQQAQAKQQTATSATSQQSAQDPNASKQKPPEPKTPEQLQAEAKLLLEKLHQLADTRGENVKVYLINRHKIAADRFFDCQTSVSQVEDAVPEVALGL